MSYGLPQPILPLISRTVQREAEVFCTANSYSLRWAARSTGLALQGACMKDGLGGKPDLVSLGSPSTPSP